MTPTEAAREVIESLIDDLNTYDGDDFLESAYDNAIASISEPEPE